MFKEFKEFATKGNVIDLAVGVIIGGAFNKIVSSLVNDIVMPVVGLLTGGINFSYLSLILRKAQVDAPALTLNYGQFIQNVVDFLIIAFFVFLLVKALNRSKRKEEAEKSSSQKTKTSRQEELLEEIRDLLKIK